MSDFDGGLDLSATTALRFRVILPTGSPGARLYLCFHPDWNTIDPSSDRCDADKTTPPPSDPRCCDDNTYGEDKEEEQEDKGEGQNKKGQKEEEQKEEGQKDVNNKEEEDVFLYFRPGQRILWPSLPLSQHRLRPALVTYFDTVDLGSYRNADGDLRRHRSSRYASILSSSGDANVIGHQRQAMARGYGIAMALVAILVMVSTAVVPLHETVPELFKLYVGSLLPLILPLDVQGNHWIAKDVVRAQETELRSLCVEAEHRHHAHIAETCQRAKASASDAGQEHVVREAEVKGVVRNLFEARALEYKLLAMVVRDRGRQQQQQQQGEDSGGGVLAELGHL
ncbi:hypothetical protein LY76DRAFT_651139 [Colletotrichum caudatum]|nr:hypothetical protein LY76DRAFT_651139 [Colletotrichum caudatum]